MARSAKRAVLERVASLKAAWSPARIGGLAVAVGLVALAIPDNGIRAAVGPGVTTSASITYGCVLRNPDGTPFGTTTPPKSAVTASMTVPSTVTVGSQFPVTVTLDPGILNGPINLTTIPPTFEVHVTVGGGGTPTDLATTVVSPIGFLPNVATKTPPMTGTVTAPSAPGTLSFTMAEVDVSATVGITVITKCTPENATVMATTKVEAPPTPTTLPTPTTIPTPTTVPMPPDACDTDQELRVSRNPWRWRSKPLDGAELGGHRWSDVAIFWGSVDDDTDGVDRIEFSLDDTVVRTDRRAPYDLLGSRRWGRARMLDVDELAEGAHSVSVSIWLDGKAEPCGHRAEFTVEHDRDHHHGWWRSILDDLG